MDNRRREKWSWVNLCVVQHVQRKVGNGATWPWEIGRNVVMAWGNVGSQQHDHDAICAYMALHKVILTRGTTGMRQ